MQILKRPLALALAAVSLASARVNQQPEFDHTHAQLTAVLATSLKDGLVDYAGLRESPKALDAYVATLSATTPALHAEWTREQRFAFWINAYNAFTLKLIRDEGPVKSIKDLGGLFSTPWEKKFIPLPAFDPEGKNKPLTLDEIEHELIRPVFKDARVHAAINCASLGCPPLRAKAFSAETLDADLEDQVGVWLRDATRNRVQPKDGKIQVSKIFDWFAKDFGASKEELVRWIAKHVGDEDLAATLAAAADSVKLKYVEYDWALNAQAGKR